MTYEEAIERKKQLLIEGNGSVKESEIMIAPNLESDLKNFLETFKRIKYTDELCKKFSSDNKYSVQLYR
jgi:hypothetical protein